MHGRDNSSGQIAQARVGLRERQLLQAQLADQVTFVVQQEQGIQ